LVSTKGRPRLVSIKGVVSVPIEGRPESALAQWVLGEGRSELVSTKGRLAPSQVEAQFELASTDSINVES